MFLFFTFPFSFFSPKITLTLLINSGKYSYRYLGKKLGFQTSGNNVPDLAGLPKAAASKNFRRQVTWQFAFRRNLKVG